jgi:hypothetical protein
MLTSDFFNQPVEENCKYGRYYCTTDKKYKCRQGPKQTRQSEAIESAQNVSETRENYNGINILLQKDDDELFVKASAGSKELGHVLFAIDGEYLLPQDLEVEERFRGQGIAQTMYDFVKSKGYKIRRSGQQTDAGAGFWDKHRAEQNVWEQEETNPVDTVEMDVPLLIRALEYAREDAKDDMDLHRVVERMIKAAQAGETLNMDDYNMIFGDQQENPKEVDEAKRKKKPKSKSSLMSKPAKRKYGGYYYPGYGYYGDSGDSGDGGGGGESRINEKKDKTKLSTLDLRSELDAHATTLLNIARRKYPMAKSDLAALIKLLDRVQLHSIEKDTAHDKDIKAIRRDVAALEKRVNELYKKQKVKESRLYYSVAGTLNESLRKDFKMRKDRKGWFLPESASARQKLDAERAFGEPIAEMNLLRPIKMKGPKNPVAVNQNGNKYKNPAKLIKFGK